MFVCRYIVSCSRAGRRGQGHGGGWDEAREGAEAAEGPGRKGRRGQPVNLGWPVVVQKEAEGKGRCCWHVGTPRSPVRCWWEQAWPVRGQKSPVERWLEVDELQWESQGRVQEGQVNGGA